MEICYESNTSNDRFNFLKRGIRRYRDIFRKDSNDNAWNTRVGSLIDYNSTNKTPTKNIPDEFKKFTPDGADDVAWWDLKHLCGWAYSRLGDDNELALCAAVFASAYSIDDLSGSGNSHLKKIDFNMVMELAKIIGVTRIPSQMFTNVLNSSNPTNKIVIPDFITAIDDSAFSYFGVTEAEGEGVVLAQSPSLKSISQKAFFHSDIKAINLYGSSVTRIEPNTFAECDFLEMVVLPEGVTNVDSGWFGGKIPENLKIVVTCPGGEQGKIDLVPNKKELINHIVFYGDKDTEQVTEEE